MDTASKQKAGGGAKKAAAPTSGAKKSGAKAKTPLAARSRYTTGKPFPSLAKLKPDIGLAKALYEDYAGQIGEISASMIYEYQHIKLNGQAEKKAAAVMQGIYLVENAHLKQLGEMIERLGADADFAVPGVEKRYWRADMIPYPKTVKAMVARDLAFEKKTIQSYENTLNRVTEPTVRKTLQLILEDEKLHVKALEQLQKELEKRAAAGKEKTKAPAAKPQQGASTLQRATAKKNDAVVRANQGAAAKNKKQNPAARAARSTNKPPRTAASRQREKRV